MRPNIMLAVASLLLILLSTLHLTDDFLYLKAGVTPSGFAISILILVVWLCGALLLSGRPLGYVITLLGSVLGLAIPFLHMMSPAGLAGSNVAQSSGPFFFVWTLLAIGMTSLFCLILSVQGLWGLLRGRRAGPV